jgi:oligopeptide transport system ATP-binding protein
VTLTDDQNRASEEEPAVTELPENVSIATEEGRKLAEQLADADRSHAKRLLEVRNLSTQFFTRDGTVHAVDDVSFELDYSETLGLVGESGCGKSVTALSLVRLVPFPPGRIVSGEIIFDGIDVMKLSNEEMRLLRGKKIGFIFQDPLTSLNPTLPIGFQIAESARIHLGLSRKKAADRAV